MRAQAETQERKTCSGTGARCRARPRARAADDLSAENIEGLTNVHEGVGGLFVGKGEEKL